MVKNMEILFIAAFMGISVACFAAPPANPLEETVQVVTGVAEASVQFAGSVVDQLQRMVRGPGKPLPPRRNPEFMADEKAIGFEITADYFGKYIWRGQNISDDPVYQPGVSMTMGGLTAALWGNLETTKINNNSGEFTEYDWALDYSGDVPGVEGVGYSVGVINYYFPSLEDTTEVYWGFAFDLPLSPSVTVYHDVDDIKGTYASFGLGHSIERIAEINSDTPIGMEIGASLGWGSASYNNGYWDSSVKSSRLNDLALSVSFPVDVGGWTVAPNLNYVTLVNNKIRQTDTFDKASDYFFAGISVSMSF